MTHTYAELEISQKALQEIREKLSQAYQGDRRSLEPYLLDGGIVLPGVKLVAEAKRAKSKPVPLWAIQGEVTDKRGRARGKKRRVKFTVSAPNKREARWQFDRGAHLVHLLPGSRCDLDFTTLRREKRPKT